MSTEPTDVTADLAILRQRHPQWFFTSVWAAIAPGPDRRLILAQRNGITISDATAEAVSAKIRREESRLIPRDM